jgi:hypothetical protein
MNLANRKFRDNSTGELIKVIDSFENIAILENKQKIDVRRLMNPSFYTEEIDPKSFLNINNAYSHLVDKIKNLNTDNLIDEATTKTNESYTQTQDPYRPISNESAIVEVSEDDERAELARRYGVIDNREATIKQQEAFSKLLNDEDLPEPPATVNSYTISAEESIERIEIQRDQTGVPVSKPVEKPEDPIQTMFKGIKRSVDFTLDLQLNNKIPKLEFIEMMEESYERSIIDYLAGEIANDLIKDPYSLKLKIAQKIKDMVYNKPAVKKVVKKTTTRKPVTKKTLDQKKMEDDLVKIIEDKPKRRTKKLTQEHD